MDAEPDIRQTPSRGPRVVGGPAPRYDVGVALLLGAATFLVYLWSIMPGAFPGEPASLVATAVGVKPSLTAQHVVWRWLVAVVANLATDNVVFRVNLLSAVFGALSVGSLYLVMARTLALAIDEGQVGHAAANQRHVSVRIARQGILLGGVTAALALAFAIPFWIASTQSYYHTFYICWLLLGILCLLQYVRTDRLGWALLFALLHGAGMSQTASFVAFAPLLGAAVLYSFWNHDRIYPGALLPLVAAGLLGGSLILVNAWSFYGSDGFRLMGFGGYYQIVRVLLKDLQNGILGSLPRVGWMIIVGLTIAPWLAALVAGLRALNGERDWSFYALHGALAIVTVAVLVDIKASPWRFFGVSNVTIVPYLLASMTFGYLATYLYLLPMHLWAVPDRPQLVRLQRGLRAAVALGALLFCGAVAVSNHRQADHGNTRFIALYADRVLDSLEGRTWLATNGVLDDVLLLRARERGIPLNCLNLAEANDPVAIKIAKQKLDNVRLRNTVDLGFVSLLQEWIASEPSASRDLALALVPDLWGLANYEMLPSGLVFLGATPDEMKAVSVEAWIARHEALWDEMDRALAEVPDDASDRVLFYRNRIVRPQTSFVGNNLGFMLESLDKAPEAFLVYDRMHAFDPDNVSALLNWATMVFNGHAPEKKDAVARDLESLNRRLEGTQLPIWSLSRVFGYVSRPETFAQLGWSWAGSGQPRLAINALQRAEASTPAEHRGALKSSIARIHMLQDRPEESERVYFEMLVEDAGNREALMGLVRIFALRGDAARAREFLGRAEKAGVPRVPLLIATALVTQVEGNTAVARAILQEQVDLDPTNSEAWAYLCALLTQERDAKALQVAVQKLEETAGSDSFNALVARGSQAVMLADLRAARDFFLRAHRLQPTAVVLLDRVLHLDFEIADKVAGAEHARTMLRLDAKNSFGNYIMGSLAMERRDYESAEDYLRRSVEGDQTVANLNDLAVVLVRRNQLQEADLRIQQAFKIDDQNYAAWDTYGMVRLAKGELDEAEMAFNTALKHESTDLRIHVHLAEVMFRKNEIARASEIIRAVAKEVDTLPREDWEQFEDLHLKVLGVKFAKGR